MRKVVVTGIGVLTPLGIQLDEHMDSLKRGLCGINMGSGSEGSAPFTTGAVPVFNPKDFIEDKKSIKVMNRRTTLGCCAAKLALSEAGLVKDILVEDEDNSTIIGSGVVEGITNFIDALASCLRNDDGSIDYELLGSHGYRMLPPLWILPKLPNTTAGQISIQNSLKGLNYSIVNGPGSGFLAIGEAFTAIKDCRAKRIVCGGAESEIYTDFFWRMQQRGIASEDIKGSRPFGIESNGSIFSEGSAILVLEDEEKAAQRNKQVFGMITGYNNAYIPRFNEDGTEAIADHYERCIRKALDSAGLKVEDIDFVQAAACGMNKIDFAEAVAIKRVFGKEVYITSTHSATGNTLAASGAISVAYALIQLKNNFIAPIIRTEDLFMKDELSYVWNNSLNHESRFCLVNSFDYSGGAASLVLAKDEL